MIRLLIWLAGAMSFLWVIYHFGYWREAVGFFVLAAAFAWIIIGAVVIGRGPGASRVAKWTEANDAAVLRAAAQRAAAEQRKAEAGK